MYGYIYIYIYIYSYINIDKHICKNTCISLRAYTYIVYRYCSLACIMKNKCPPSGHSESKNTTLGCRKESAGVNCACDFLSLLQCV